MLVWLQFAVGLAHAGAYLDAQIQMWIRHRSPQLLAVVCRIAAVPSVCRDFLVLLRDCASLPVRARVRVGVYGMFGCAYGPSTAWASWIRC